MAELLRDDLLALGFREAELVSTDGHPGVFGFYDAGATTGQHYRWAHGDAKAAFLTSPKYRFETPTKIVDGLVAVEVSGAQRQLVRISSDG